MNVYVTVCAFRADCILIYCMMYEINGWLLSFRVTKMFYYVSRAKFIRLFIACIKKEHIYKT